MALNGSLTGKKVAVIGVVVTLASWLLLEVVSISEWSANTIPFGGGRIGVIHYRPIWGELNRATMTINEGLLWVFGYEMIGPSSYGQFDVWMHTYRKPE